MSNIDLMRRIEERGRRALLDDLLRERFGPEAAMNRPGGNGPIRTYNGSGRLSASEVERDEE